MTNPAIPRIGLLALALVLVASPTTIAQIPDLDAPLIKGVSPDEGMQLRQVVIVGVNFGSAPQVHFGSEPATVEAYVPERGYLLTSVPLGASSGPLTVTNTDISETSNAADFTVPPGSWSSVCTITGNVTDDLGMTMQGVNVVALEIGSDAFVGWDASDVSGNFSIGVDTVGNYRLGFFAPNGTRLHDEWYTVACSGSQNHQFAEGWEICGRVISDVPGPIRNAALSISGTADFGIETLTDANGDFCVIVPPDTYEVVVEGPIGGRHITTIIEDVVVPPDRDLGDITLATGVIVSGALRYQHDTDSGPLGDYRIAEFDDIGEIAGTTTTIVDGSFYLPSPTGSWFTLWIPSNILGLLDLMVSHLDVTGDMDLDVPFTMYTHVAQLPRTPVITESNALVVQVDQRIVLHATHLRGNTATVRFPRAGGGTVDGINTLVEADRGVVVTTVPSLAVTGDVVVRIDGVDSPGYPLTVDGTYVPGPFTTSGTVDHGTIGVQDVFVAMVEIVCGGDNLIDYDLTDGNGLYSLEHGSGDFELLFLPAVDSGFPFVIRDLPGVTGGGTENVTLPAVNVVTAVCVDSGAGPVGGTGPIEDCGIGADRDDADHEDEALTRPDGSMNLSLPSGDYWFNINGPFRSRFTATGSDLETIDDDTDFGDVTVDSGFFIEGRVVDTVGNGLAGVQVSAVQAFVFQVRAITETVGSDGSFRLAVPPGDYQLYFDAHRDHDLYVPPILGYLPVYQDTHVYPAVQAEIVGYVEGTVTDASMAAIPGIPMSAWHEVYGPVDDAESCSDGTYRLRAPTGDFEVRAYPSEVGPCLVDEVYDGHYTGCGNDPVAVNAPSTVTGIDFTLEPAGVLGGTVADDLGAGVWGVTVCATAQPSLGFCYQDCATTEADGTWSLANVPVGDDFRIEASGAGYPTECWDDHVGCADYDPVAVADCQLTPGIDFLVSAAPGPVPDGNATPGTPMTAAYNRGTGEITVSWQPTCSADTHAIYLGPLGSFSSYTDAECDVGMAGSWTFVPPTGDVFWVVVGVNGANDGSYGVDGDLLERPSAGPGLCGYIQDPSAGCIP
jgi:hypothetical protein